MTRRQKDPLRLLTAEEQTVLDRLSRSQMDPASHVARAKALLAVAAGRGYSAAALAAGRLSGDAVAHLVTRFNQHGLAPLCLGMAVALRLPRPWPNAIASLPKPAARQSVNAMARLPGHS